jgi:hypothetical protein
VTLDCATPAPGLTASMREHLTEQRRFDEQTRLVLRRLLVGHLRPAVAA